MKPPRSSLNKHRQREAPVVKLTFTDRASAKWVSEALTLLNRPVGESDMPLVLCQRAVWAFVNVDPAEEILERAVPVNPTLREACEFTILLRDQLMRQANYLDCALASVGVFTRPGKSDFVTGP